ncbi:MAG TPA: RsmB/NOP family class I SAM-dependent RNA methyltransferase [Hyphomicrobiales bacterium]|nr:RsmB/NOP family class I SAM-dependent RNA methyltransferase [Hyphomicrobiales bacterium]
MPPRRAALTLLVQVLRERRSLAELMARTGADTTLARLDERERALTFMILLTCLRRLGQIDAALRKIYSKGIPARGGELKDILRIAAAQILFLQVPAHAAVDLAVRLANQDPKARHFTGLANAGLRRLAERAGALLAEKDETRINTPRWLWASWVETYGEKAAHDIGAAHLVEPALDLTVKANAGTWAEKLGARLLPTGTLRLAHKGPVEQLEGFAEGAWWVQDAAAALPARLLGDVAGRTVIDLCAAPGGKTAQLAAAGAKVVAVEKSPRRARRLAENLRRLRLDAEIIVADALDWTPGEPADAVLLDAPCTATGTIRRHPDAAWLKLAKDRDTLVPLQRALLARAITMVRPGGLLVYATCSLLSEEGENQTDALLASGAPVRRDPVAPEELPALKGAITAKGELRTLPSMLPDPDPQLAGLDGFFAARLIRL